MSSAETEGSRLALFRFEHVAVRFDDAAVLEDVDTELPDSGITVVAGPSGCGKSTLLRLCNRLEVPAAGRVLFRGSDVASQDPLELRRRVGMVFQRPTPFAGTAWDNLRVAVPGIGEEQAVDLLVRAGLPADLLERDASDLSGGEAQRLCLARALATRPEVLLLDEPTSALDPQARLALEQQARSLAESGMPLVWVTHDIEQLYRLADHVVVLLDGRARFAGPPSALPSAGEAVSGFLSGNSPGRAS